MKNNIINPYSISLEINVTKQTNYLSVVNLANDRKIREQVILMETDEFTRLYKSAKKRDILMSLSLPSTKLFLYIQYQLESGQDYITLVIDKVCDRTNMSHVSIRKAILELGTNNILTKRMDMPHTYWLNPIFLFCGSRPNKYPDNVVVVRERANGINLDDN